jgi:hypothetical protein
MDNACVRHSMHAAAVAVQAEVVLWNGGRNQIQSFHCLAINDLQLSNVRFTYSCGKIV